MPCATPSSSVLDFYKNGKIFITGATGFFGKTLLEKLLRVCPDIDRIYVLVRVKKGKDPQTRLKDIFSDPIFKVIREKQPDFEKKVTCVPGHLTALRLDMSDNDYESLTKEVTHVFHCAATVRFDEPLGSAININVLGTLEITSFCKKCIRLKVLVYVSTAFVHCFKNVMDEEYCEPAITAENALALNKIFDSEKLEELTPQIIKPWPNTYSFTKAIAETSVRAVGGAFPVAIFRPSIVMGTWKEPIEGWVDNIYGPMGILFGKDQIPMVDDQFTEDVKISTGAGLMRVLYANKNSRANLVPVDCTINALLCCGWDVGSRYNKAVVENSLDSSKKITANGEKTETSPKIFQFVSSKDNAITWDEFAKKSLSLGLRFPVSRAIWYYTLTLMHIKPLYNFLFFLYHCVPGALGDGILLLLGKKPLLIKAYKKIYYHVNILSAYSLSSWNFSDNNIRNTWNRLNDTDKSLFHFDMSVLNWDLYLENVVNGMRTYIFHEKEDLLPYAKRKMFLFWLGHRFLQLCTLAFCFWIFSKLYFMFRGFSEEPFDKYNLTKPELVRNFT